MNRRAFLLALVGVFACGSCASVAHVTNVRAPECARDFESQLDSILRDQGESPEIASSLARETVDALAARDRGPRPFLVSSSSGADYSFFVQKKATCVLRLYGRRKGFVTYTNNLTYIATRALPSCECAE